MWEDFKLYFECKWIRHINVLLNLSQRIIIIAVNHFRELHTSAIYVKAHTKGHMRLDEVCRASDGKLFASITNNREHVLHELLPPVGCITEL